jgi:hypothetical protein
VEASGGFRPTGWNGGKAAEAQTGAVRVGTRGEARREATSDRVTAASGPARPDCGAALMAQARAWRALPWPVERGAARGARWSGGSDRWTSARKAGTDRWDPAPVIFRIKNTPE